MLSEHFSRNMLQRKFIVFLALFLIHQSCSIQASEDKSKGSACTLSKTSPAPEVTPWNATHIKVTWENVLVNCKKKDIQALYVIVNQTMHATTEDFMDMIESGANEAFLERSPCLEHKVYLKLHLAESNMKASLSDKTEYL